jgi:YVTN family beta-propeller protein
MHRTGRAVLWIGLAGPWLTATLVLAAEVYHSPLGVVAAPDGKTLHVCDPTSGCVVVLDAAAGTKVRELPVPGQPGGMALSADGKTLYVTQRQAGAVAVIDTVKGAIAGQIPVGPWPVALALAESSQRLYTCNRGDHTVSVVDLVAGKVVQRVPVVRDPVCIALTPDQRRLVVTNYMPHGRGTEASLAAEVSILDTAAMTQAARVQLPPGSTAVSGACLSPDGKWAYVVHAVGRFNVPITQLERGWVHTYALSILDVAASSLRATLLLDDLTRGAADPWAVVGSRDGARLWISHAGVHEVSMVDIGRIHDLLEGKLPAELAGLKDGTRDNVWVRISKDRGVAGELVNDLTALYIAGAIHRAQTGGRGPRGLALSPDERKLFVANYFSGTIGVLGAAEGKLLATVPVGPQPPPDATRRGELYFHDATRCFQSWHSCASCHLDDGRVDGLPWDFTRDGLGNPKDVISLVYVQHTSPHNRRATRRDPRECMRTGVTGSHFVVPEPADVEDLLAYASSLRPEPNPNLGKLAAAAARGKLLFDGKAGCAICHPGPYFTDKRMHDVGMLTPNEPDGRYKTPSLIEAYRTAPYYHDGRAATIREALTSDPKGLHGNLKELTPREIEDLEAYVLSL